MRRRAHALAAARGGVRCRSTRRCRRRRRSARSRSRRPAPRWPRRARWRRRRRPRGRAPGSSAAAGAAGAAGPATSSAGQPATQPPHLPVPGPPPRVAADGAAAAADPPEADDVGEPPGVAAVLVVEVDRRAALGAGGHGDDVVGVAQERAARVDELARPASRRADVGRGLRDVVGRAQDVAVAVAATRRRRCAGRASAPTRAATARRCRRSPRRTSDRGQHLEPAPAHRRGPPGGPVRTTAPATSPAARVDVPARPGPAAGTARGRSGR